MLSGTTKQIYIYLALLLICVLFPISAQARIDITPTRIVMDPRDRSAEITILNLTDKPGTIRIGLINYKQKPDGIYEVLEGPLDAAFNPDNVVRISPRQFTLAPGGRQKVRISLRRDASLPDGAYRFHIKATRFADATELNVGTEDSQAQIGIGTNVGIVVPVIVKHGNVETDIKISDVNLVRPPQTKSGKPEIQLKLNRSGNGAVIGSLKAFWEPSNGAQSMLLGERNNMNVFHELAYRQARIPIEGIPGEPGRLRIIYMDDMSKEILDDVYVNQ
jgi:hypothetical protein